LHLPYSDTHQRHHLSLHDALPILLLNLCKQVMVNDRVLRSGQPFPPLREVTPGFEVAGAVLGLVGLGRIGSRVATIALVLGMKVDRKSTRLNSSHDQKSYAVFCWK